MARRTPFPTLWGLPISSASSDTVEGLQVPITADGEVKVDAEKIGGSLPVSKDYGDDLSSRYLDALAKRKAADADLTEVENEIKNALGSFELMVDDETGRVLFTWNATVKRVLDVPRLKREKPKLVQEYRRSQVTRTFRTALTTKRSRFARL